MIESFFKNEKEVSMGDGVKREFKCEAAELTKINTLRIESERGKECRDMIRILSNFNYQKDDIKTAIALFWGLN